METRIAVLAALAVSLSGAATSLADGNGKGDDPAYWRRINVAAQWCARRENAEFCRRSHELAEQWLAEEAHHASRRSRRPATSNRGGPSTTAPFVPTMEGGCHHPVGVASPSPISSDYATHLRRKLKGAGVDIPGNIGDPIVAMWFGRILVNYAWDQKEPGSHRYRAGHFIQMEHCFIGGVPVLTPWIRCQGVTYVSEYMHLFEGTWAGRQQPEREQRVGAWVNMGKEIGRMGRTAVMNPRTLTHLHLQVRRGGNTGNNHVDPQMMCPALK